MDAEQTVLQTLQTLAIPYTLYTHEAVHTIDDCMRLAGIDRQTVEIPRNAFLCNRQQTAFYLMLLRHEVPFRTAVVSKALGVSRLSFAPPERLPALLGLQAGAVSPLGLLFDTERRVRLVLDEGLRAFSHWALHPCVNTASVVLRAADFLDVFLPHIHVQPTWVNPLEKEDFS